MYNIDNNNNNITIESICSSNYYIINKDLEILVKENKLTGIRHLISVNVIDAYNKGKFIEVQLRIGVPATFDPVFLMPPIQNEIDELILVIFDESGTELQRTKGQPKLVFVPKNSAAQYTLKAYFDGAEADFISYPFASSLNSVNVIATSNMKVENEKIRPGTFMKFTVQNSKFMDDTVASEIIETENTQIKWYENSETIAGTGPSYENTYQKEGKYTIICRVTEGKPGWFTADKNDADDRTFYITKNYPTAIEKTSTGISKIGRQISFELKGIFKIDNSDKNTIHWRLIGPETKETTASPTFEFTPTKKGTYKLYVSMNGGKTKDPFEFECTACEIIKGWWTDGDGNILTGKDDTSDPNNTLGVAGWGQEVCVAFKHIGLGGEDVTIEVWDKDKYSTTSVFKKDLTVTDGYTIMTSSIKLDDEIKKNVAKKGLLSDGLLYFTVTVNNGLKVVNNGMVLPVGETNYLKVDDTLRAKAYFADNNDTKRYSTASTDMPVYVQVKSRNLIGDELELIIYKSINWGIDKKYEEEIAFKVDKYGMASVKLDMCIFNDEFSNPNDSVSLYVKILRKSDSEELYSSEGKYPLTLYKKLNTSPASTNTTKAFVLVDTSDGEKNGNSSTYCYCLKDGSVTISCNGKGCLIDDEKYNKIASKLEIETEVMKAIAKQESKRNGFWKEGQATILFERHKMWKYLLESGKTIDELNELKELYPKIVNKTGGEYGEYSAQYEKLKIAKTLNYSSAIKSCSWGKFQVMGFNYNVAFESPEEMELAVNICELQQFKLFVGYLENTSGLIKAMKDKDWKSIAKRYNGLKWEETNPDYASNLEEYYNELK